MRNDPRVLYDGFSAINLGVNSGLAPVSLRRDELAWAINTTFRNNFPTTRPGIVRRNLSFPKLSPGAIQFLFKGGIFQGASAFERHGNLAVAINGLLWSIDLKSYAVSLPSQTTYSTKLNRAWFAEAENWLIQQDGQGAAKIFDGAIVRPSDTFGVNGGVPEVPTGTAMAYVNGRLAVALQDGYSFVVGDIVGGASGTVNYGFKDAVLKFTENELIGRGGSFGVPVNSGPIRAICPVAQVDTSLGQGPAQVYTTGGIFSLNTPTDRTQWAAVTFPLETVSMIRSGGLSDRATGNVNGDIWTRSYDGIRTFQVARRDFQASWVNAPVSQEMQRVIGKDDENLLSYASAATFDNRRLTTIAPYRTPQGIAHRGLAVIDFASVAYLSGRSEPLWEGIWTGLQVLQILTGLFNGVERCFIFALAHGNEISLWELTKSASDDNDGINNVPIEWQVESGGLTFPTAPGQETVPSQNLISFDGAKLFVDEMQGTQTFTAAYRMDQHPCWVNWHQFATCAAVTTCPSDGDRCCVTPLNLETQYRQPFWLPQPVQQFDPITSKQLNTGRELQVRLVMVGKCRIKRLETIAHWMEEDVTSVPQPATEVCQKLPCITCESDYNYVLA
jgi:hypothetical protein